MRIAILRSQSLETRSTERIGIYWKTHFVASLSQVDDEVEESVLHPRRVRERRWLHEDGDSARSGRVCLNRLRHSRGARGLRSWSSMGEAAKWSLPSGPAGHPGRAERSGGPLGSNRCSPSLPLALGGARLARLAQGARAREAERSSRHDTLGARFSCGGEGQKEDSRLSSLDSDFHSKFRGVPPTSQAQPSGRASAQDVRADGCLAPR